MRPVLGRSPWVSRFPKSRIPAYPKYRGTLDLDMAIIGGGLTGSATAYACAAAGLTVGLFEGDRLGRGATAASSGWITDDPPCSFAELQAAVGRRAARQAFQSWRRSARELAALVRRLDLACRLEARPTLTVSRTADELERLARERKARVDAGIDAALISARQATAAVGFPVSGALKSAHTATFDPYRACLGLASAAAARGAHVFERSPVTRTGFAGDRATLTLDTGEVSARHVLVATGMPTHLFKPIARHFSIGTRFHVLTAPTSARVRKALGTRAHVVRDLAAPPHTIAWVDDERVLVEGGDASEIPARLLERTIVQRTGQLMYELSTFYPDLSGLQAEYGWSAAIAATAHGLPVIGPHRNYPHHLFAIGDAGHGVTAAHLASRIVLRHCLDTAEPADEAFVFRL
ncbi:MAG: NAD(P)/FAD-dependent oxidoreductase [Vicinamibacterales bacterium]